MWNDRKNIIITKLVEESSICDPVRSRLALKGSGWPTDLFFSLIIIITTVEEEFDSPLYSLGRVRERKTLNRVVSLVPSRFFFSLSTHSRRGYTFLSRLYIHSLLLLYTDIRLFFFYLKKKKNPYISNIPLWTFGRGIIRRRGNSSNVFKRLKGPWANLIFFDENLLLLIGQCSPFPFFKAFFVFRATGKTGEETPTSCGNDIPPHLQGKTTSLNFQRISSSP